MGAVGGGVEAWAVVFLPHLLRLCLPTPASLLPLHQPTKG